MSKQMRKEMTTAETTKRKIKEEHKKNRKHETRKGAYGQVKEKLRKRMSRES